MEETPAGNSLQNSSKTSPFPQPKTVAETSETALQLTQRRYKLLNRRRPPQLPLRFRIFEDPRQHPHHPQIVCVKFWREPDAENVTHRQCALRKNDPLRRTPCAHHHPPHRRAAGVRNAHPKPACWLPCTRGGIPQPAQQTLPPQHARIAPQKPRHRIQSGCRVQAAHLKQHLLSAKQTGD